MLHDLYSTNVEHVDLFKREEFHMQQENFSHTPYEYPLIESPQKTQKVAGAPYWFS